MTQHKFGSFLFFLSIIFSFTIVTCKPETHNYILKNANIAKYDVVGRDTITTFIGSVNLIYDNIEFFSDNAKIFKNKKLVELHGNVKAIDDTTEIEAENVKYFHEDKFLEIWEDAIITEYNSLHNLLRTVEADSMKYNKKNKWLHAKKNIFAKDMIEDANLTCGDFEYNFADDYGKAKLLPILTFEKDEKIQIFSKQMEMLTAKNKFTATYDVKVKTNNSHAESKFLIYFQEDEKAVLIGDPVFTSDLSTATANEFRILFNDKTIQELHLIKNAVMYFSESKTKDKNNYLFAENITIELVNEKMSYLEASQVEKSFIEQNQQDDKDYYINKLKTKNLQVFFNDKEKINKVIAKDNIAGIYKFPSR